jgi:hypothetical protein
MAELTSDCCDPAVGGCGCSGPSDEAVVPEHAASAIVRARKPVA